MAQGYAGHRHARLNAFLDDPGFKGFDIRGSLARGNPDDKCDGVHVSLSEHHRPYRFEKVTSLDAYVPLACIAVQAGLNLSGLLNIMLNSAPSSLDHHRSVKQR